MPRLYNKYRKNPQYIILIFTNPIVKIPSPKKDSASCLFYFMQVFVKQMPARRAPFGEAKTKMGETPCVEPLFGEAKTKMGETPYVEIIAKQKTHREE